MNVKMKKEFYTRNYGIAKEISGEEVVLGMGVDKDYFGKDIILTEKYVILDGTSTNNGLEVMLRSDHKHQWNIEMYDHIIKTGLIKLAEINGMLVSERMSGFKYAKAIMEYFVSKEDWDRAAALQKEIEKANKTT